MNCNRPNPVIWKTVPIRINILKLLQVNFCIENITLSKFQGDTRHSFPDIAFRIYINSYEKLGNLYLGRYKVLYFAYLKSEGTISKNIVIIIRFNIHG